MIDIDLLLVFFGGYLIGRCVGFYQQRKSEDAWASTFLKYATDEQIRPPIASGNRRPRYTP